MVEAREIGEVREGRGWRGIVRTTMVRITKVRITMVRTTVVRTPMVQKKIGSRSMACTLIIHNLFSKYSTGA